METWFAPSEINFSREQMIFLILNLKLLAHGTYPPDPKGSGYIDPPVNTKRKKKRAPFETPAQLYAELTFRLQQTGLSGKLLVAEVGAGYTFEELSRESRTALNYISGWARRKQSYSQWKADRQYKKKR